MELQSGTRCVGRACAAGVLSLALVCTPARAHDQGPAGGLRDRSELLPLSVPSGAEPLRGSGFDPAMLAVFTERVNAIRGRSRDCGSAGSFLAAAPVSYDERLAEASLAHLNDMIERNYFAHAGAPDSIHRAGTSLSERLRAAGYPWTAGRFGKGSGATEVLGFGQRSFDQLLQGWLASPSHCAAIMSPSMRQFGVAIRVRSDDVPFWGMVLGRPPR